MTAATAPATAPAATGDPGMDHVYCGCNPDIALCGVDISGADFADFGEPDCVVCADLDETDAPCTLCSDDPAVTS